MVFACKLHRQQYLWAYKTTHLYQDDFVSSLSHLRVSITETKHSKNVMKTEKKEGWIKFYKDVSVSWFVTVCQVLVVGSVNCGFVYLINVCGFLWGNIYYYVSNFLKLLVSTLLEWLSSSEEILHKICCENVNLSDFMKVLNVIKRVDGRQVMLNLIQFSTCPHVCV